MKKYAFLLIGYLLPSAPLQSAAKSHLLFLSTDLGDLEEELAALSTARRTSTAQEKREAYVAIPPLPLWRISPDSPAPLTVRDEGVEAAPRGFYASAESFADTVIEKILSRPGNKKFAAHCQTHPLFLTVCKNSLKHILEKYPEFADRNDPTLLHSLFAFCWQLQETEDGGEDEKLFTDLAEFLLTHIQLEAWYTGLAQEDKESLQRDTDHFLTSADTA